MPKPSVAAPLLALGFSALEANAYCVLLTTGEETGYGVAKALGKPVANTYHALESLVAKGAATRSEGAARKYHPTEPELLFRHLEADFARRTHHAARALRGLTADSSGGEVYALESAQLVIERVREMIARANEIILADVFPAALAWIAPDLEKAAARGVVVSVLAYAPSELENVDIVVHPLAYKLRHEWAGQWCNVVTDGAECVIAHLTTDGEDVHQAVYTRSPFLSWVYQSGVEGELIAASVGVYDQSMPDDATLRAAIKAARARARRLAGKRPRATVSLAEAGRKKHSRKRVLPNVK